MSRIAFYVPGIPAPGGSKKFVGLSKKTGRAILVDDAGKRNKDWRSAVAWAGKSAMQGRPLLDGPLKARFEFIMPRPKNHFGAKGLKPSAPAWPTVKPDALKLTRSSEDALTGIVWTDDAQIVKEEIEKRYAAPGEASGAVITVMGLN